MKSKRNANPSIFSVNHSWLVLARVSVVAALVLWAAPSSARARGRAINVRTVNELYAAVNGSGNRNVTVRLAPGTYVLSNLNRRGEPRPNGGALRLQPGMALVGSEERVDSDGDGVPDPVSPETPDEFTVPGTETIIDGSGLELPFADRTDCTALDFKGFPDPVVHIGVRNSLSNLTIFVGGNVAISEPNDPIDPAGNLSIEITNTVLESSFAVMSFANTQCAARRARSVLTFSHNIVRGGGFFGLNIANFFTGDGNNDGSEGPATWATITSNLFYNNGTGLRTAGGEKGTDGGSVTVFMRGNVFRNNGRNFFALGATGGLSTPAIGNRLSVRSEFDTFGEAPTNVFLIASNGLDDVQGSEISAEFLHSHFIRDSQDSGAEISITGGGGSDCHAEVLIRGATVRTSSGDRTRGALSIEDSTEPGAGSTTARLEGSRRAFIQRNQGLPAPPPSFFLEQ